MGTNYKQFYYIVLYTFISIAVIIIIIRGHVKLFFIWIANYLWTTRPEPDGKDDCPKVFHLFDFFQVNGAAIVVR